MATTDNLALRTWTLEDRGYDCNKHNVQWDCTAETLMDAIRMLDGYSSARYAQPINDVRGCSTLAVYQRTGHSADSWNKIGCVYVVSVRPAG